MKNVMLSLMLLLFAITGMNAKTLKSLDVRIPLPVQSEIDDLFPGSDSLLLNGPISIADNKEAGIELKLYPNPATTNLIVSLDCSSLTDRDPVYMYVIDMSGRIVMAIEDTVDPGNIYHKDLNVGVLPNDDYVFHIIMGNHRLVKKFQVYY